VDAAGFEPARISSMGLKSIALTNSAKHPSLFFNGIPYYILRLVSNIFKHQFLFEFELK